MLHSRIFRGHHQDGRACRDQEKPGGLGEGSQSILEGIFASSQAAGD